MRYLLDTNVLSEARKQPAKRDPVFHGWIETTPALEAAVSVITLGEILAGVIRLERRDPVQGAHLHSWYGNVLAQFHGRILPVTSDIADIEAGFQANGPVPKAGALIAATARWHGLMLVTRNVQDFRCTGVLWFNPWTLQSG